MTAFAAERGVRRLLVLNSGHNSHGQRTLLTAGEVMARLQSIAPDFRAFWDDPANLSLHEDGSYTFHGMFAAFSHFVLEHFAALNEAPRIELFQFVEECVSHHPRSDTDLSNAVCTCFIENITNEPTSEQVRSYLGPNSLAYFDAWNNPADPDAA